MSPPVRWSRDAARRLGIDRTDYVLDDLVVVRSQMVGIRSGQQFVKNDAEGVNVRAGVDRLSPRLLGAEIALCPDEHPRASRRVKTAAMDGVEHLRDSEIE